MAVRVTRGGRSGVAAVEILRAPSEWALRMTAYMIRLFWKNDLLNREGAADQESDTQRFTQSLLTFGILDEAFFLAFLASLR